MKTIHWFVMTEKFLNCGECGFTNTVEELITNTMYNPKKIRMNGIHDCMIKQVTDEKDKPIKYEYNITDKTLTLYRSIYPTELKIQTLK